MRVSWFRVVMTLLYVLGFGAAAAAAWLGHEYYALPIQDRPRSELHGLFKPGGTVGHSLGVVGSAMLLLLFLYSARKRRKLGLRRGRLSRWLHVHIWFGIMGPVLITLHSSFKFHGIVSISYFSMVAVMLSGFLGRYIYIQVPRDEEGSALPLQAIDAGIEAMRRRLATEHGLSPEVISRLDPGAAGSEAGMGRAVADALLGDLLRPVKAHRLRRLLRRTSPGLPAATIREVARLAGRRAILLRRRAALRRMNAVFHYWHVVHKPFAWVMILIMIVHVTVVVAMGYTWVF